MSKIDDFNNQKYITNTVKEEINKALGRDRSDNDKHMLQVEYYEKHTNTWNEAILILHASYGYYGSSSGYSAMNKQVAKYLVKAMNTHMISIANTAIKFSQEDLEKSRIEAESEAKEVLQITQ